MISRYHDFKKDGVEWMNKSKVLTYEKVMLPLRLDPDVYDAVRKKVNLQKENVRGYSMNQYLTELVMKDLKEDK